MTSFLPIYKRELKTYLQSPSTYIVVALLFLVVGLIFQNMMSGFSRWSAEIAQRAMYGQGGEAPNATKDLVQPVFQMMVSLIMFTIPMLSMRLVAEEKREGTFELLVTCPVSDWAILLGKYFALVSVGLLIALLSALFPLVVWWAGNGMTHSGSSPEWPVVASTWFGMVLIFAAYSAFGVMASAFTENQIAAAVITLIGLILWFVLGSVFELNSYPTLQTIMQELSAAQHTENFLKGVLMLKDFLFYILASFLFLFIASKTLEARRWRV